MATGFGDWSTSTKAHGVFKQIAQGEVERLRPAPRLAEVSSINQEDRSLMVKFVGETNEVKVPYTSVAPANVGQWVRIGGTTHDRYVEDVIGTTDTEARLESAEGHVNTLMTSILGDEWGESDAGEPGQFLEQIMEFFAGLGGGGGDLSGILDPVTGLIRTILLPLIPIGKLADAPINMLEGGEFSEAPTGGTSGSGWFHDKDKGRASPGSASMIGEDTRELISRLTGVDAGKQFKVEGYVSSLAGSSGTVTIKAKWWTGTNFTGEVSIGQVALPAAGWAMVSKQITPPAGVNGVTIHILGDIDEGQVWLDDLTLTRPSGTLPQSWITNLLPDLGFINDFLQGIVDTIIKTLRGVPVVGGTLAQLAEQLLGLKRTAETAEDNAAAAQSAVTTVQQIFSVRSNRPLWEGLDPTAESTFPFSQLAYPALHNHGYEVFTGFGVRTDATTKSSGVSEHHVDSTRIVGGCIRIEAPIEKRQISFIARRDGTVNSFYVDLYRMNEDGSFTLLHSSENIAVELLPQLSLMQVVIPPTLFEMGEVVMIQFRGTGTTYIRGIQLPVVGNQINFRPSQIGILRTSAIGAPPVISRVDADNMYAGETPYIQIGGDVGQLDAPRSYYDNFNRSSLGTAWSLKRGSVGGAYLSIRNGRMVNTSSMLLGSQANAVYTLPLNSDAMAVEWDQVTTTSRISGCMIGTDNDGNNGAYLYVTSTFAAIGKFINNNSEAQAYASAGGGGAGRYRLEYWPDTHTYIAYKDGVQVGSFTDSQGVFAHGKGHRFVGANIYHSSFTSGGEIDNFYAYDITEETE